MAGSKFTLTKRYGQIWYYRIPGGKWKTTGQKIKKDAVLWVEAQLRNIGLLDPLLVELTLGDWIRDFYTPGRCPHMQRMGDSRFTQNTIITNQGYIKNHILTDELCRYRLSEISRVQVILFRERLIAKKAQRTGAPLKKETINKIMGLVRLAFREARILGYINHSPADEIPDLTERQNPHVMASLHMARVFSLDELRDALGFNPLRPGGTFGRDRVLFLTAAATGMRMSEILSLRVGNVRRGSIHIVESFQADRTTGNPKHNKFRFIPIPGFLQEALEIQAKGRAPDDFIFGHPEGAKDAPGADIGGRPLSNMYWSRAFRKGVKALGITDQERQARNLTPHSFRHSLNTHLLMMGAPPILLQEYLWGSSPRSGFMGLSEMQRNYLNISHEHLKPLIPFIERIFLG